MDHLRFSREAITQAKSIALVPIAWDRPQVQGITIDGPSSLDLDDAFWLEETDDGVLLSVHIADVAELIPPGSDLDREAIARVHTRYFASGNHPMLPRILSENGLSLLEGQPRPTLTFNLTLSHDSQVQAVDIFESWLINRKRFSYADADYAIAHPTSQWHSLLKSCQSWAQILNHKRREFGALGGMTTLAGFYLDENGQLVASSQAQYQSHQIIQEFMIATNTAAARWMATADCPVLYRNHTAKEIAPGQEAMLKALLLLGSAQMIQERLSGWLNRAEYSPYLIGHFALHLVAYGHFTSPIRRLADLVNHRLIKARLRGETVPYSKLDLENLSGHINRTVVADARQARNHYRTQAKQALQTQMEAGDSFALLAPKALSRLIKYADGELNPALKEEVCARLNQDQLQIQDLYLLLVRGEDTALKHQVMARLESQVQDAASVLSMAATQEETWEGMECQELQQVGQFLTWIEVTIAGERQTTVNPGSASRKQAARHRACLLWLEHWIQGTLVGPEERVVPELSEISESDKGAIPTVLEQAFNKPLVEGQNHVGKLNHLSQALGWEAIFEFVELEEGFRCDCFLEYDGQTFRGVGTATKKKLAKQRSALEVLVQLRDGHGLGRD